jgi:hypothetical protein
VPCVTNTHTRSRTKKNRRAIQFTGRTLQVAKHHRLPEHSAEKQRNMRVSNSRIHKPQLTKEPHGNLHNHHGICSKAWFLSSSPLRASKRPQHSNGIAQVNGSRLRLVKIPPVFFACGSRLRLAHGRVDPPGTNRDAADVRPFCRCLGGVQRAEEGRSINVLQARYGQCRVSLLSLCLGFWYTCVLIQRAMREYTLELRECLCALCMHACLFASACIQHRPSLRHTITAREHGGFQGASLTDDMGSSSPKSTSACLAAPVVLGG